MRTILLSVYSSIFLAIYTAGIFIHIYKEDENLRMAKDKRRYGKNVLEFERYGYSTEGERTFVKTMVHRLAEKIAERRSELGLTQEELAELTNLSASTIRFIECHQRVPSLPVLLKIIYALDRKADIWGL